MVALICNQTTEELRHSLLCTTLDLEQTKMFAHEEIRKRDEQLIQLKDILTKTIKERDEALQKCERLMSDNLTRPQHQQQNHMTPPLSGASSIEDETLHPQQLTSNKCFTSSDCEESFMSPNDHVMNPHSSQLEEVSGNEIMDPLFPDKPLPEKGKLLQAVMKAGPLLQTLLLAGPLPQWQHPPPLLKTFEIPLVTIQCPNVSNGCGKFNRKRVLFSDGSYSKTKYQKVLLH
ncbi:uncharacterized protein LOC106419668 isoform X2 [Brassica napus]|uniref:uncharacterized protein LOC106419668 isoform X2 n=1 Tax=Brassica napus TaxID=3708 RepID=UPI0006AAAC39|nr:uncharacterized protein LOC106419668 isoform X2 [Brassica napus]